MGERDSALKARSPVLVKKPAIMNTSIGKVLIVGSNCIFNRTPTFVAELTRRAASVKLLQRTFYMSRRSPRRSVRFLAKAVGSIQYSLALPFSIVRADWIFLTASNNPEILALSFWARLFRKPVLVDYYVSFYEWMCLMMNQVDPESRFARRLIKADTTALAQRGVIHFNRCEIEHIARLLSCDEPRRPYVIPLFTKFDTYVTEVIPPRSEGAIRFVWWGSLMPLHGIELILAAFAEVAKSRSGFVLHLCFLDLERARTMLEEFGAAGRPWLQVHDKLTLADGSLPRFVNEHGDVGFSHFGTGEQAEFVGSNKIIEAMALGRTCIVADTAGNRELPRMAELFITCERTIESLTARICELIDRPETLVEKGQECRSEYHRRYSVAAAERLFAAVVDDFLKSGGIGKP